MTTEQHIQALKELSSSIYLNAVEHGWWQEPGRNFGEGIALIHSELSEALEGRRAGGQPDEHCPAFSNVEIELADVVIRVLDLGQGFGYRVPEALAAKMQFNRTRPYLHGKEF